MHPIKHFITITRHRHMVLKYCFKSGLYRQGLAHDLSKYGFCEFWRGAKYYQGTRSPNYGERITKGYSIAWLHHKGRNKHHLEYWVDVNPKTKLYEPVNVPDRYIAESICDRIAASKNYNRKTFKPEMVKEYFEKESNMIPMTKTTKEKMEYLLNYYIDNGEKALFKYMKKNMREKN